MSAITIVLLIAVTAFLLLIAVKAFSKEKTPFPPGPPNFPHFGSYLTIRVLSKYLATAITKISNFYKTDIVGCNLGVFPTVFICSYDGIREFYYNTDFDGRVDILLARMRAFNKLLGIFFTDGIYWHIQRRFSLRYMRDFGFGRRCPTLEGVIENEIKEMIELRLEGPIYECEKNVVKGELVYLPHYFNPVFINGILSVLMRTVFQRKDYDKLYTCSKYGLMFQRNSDDFGGAMSVFPYLAKFFPNMSGYNQIKESSEYFINFFKDLIDKQCDSHDPSHDRHFIDMYIRRMNEELKSKGHSTFSHEQLLLTCVDYVFPAATANGQVILMMIDHMFLNPSIQDKVHEEIDRVVGRDRMVNLDDRKDMPYTEALIRETMRYDTVVPMALPHRALRDSLLLGYEIKENTVLLPNMVAFHNDKAIWGDPENFRPERFIVNGKLCLQKDKSLPFGAGKRLCAGETYARQTIFQVFACFMQAFRVEPADGKPRTKPMERIPGIIITLPDCWVRVIPRS